ncbi:MULTISPECIES: YbgA family protein [unclassified Shewanella]|uniref:YbgA family protein n=1 Tax=unclassified Shewanella TaxID=196818 RepID=UPI00354C3356
MVNRETFNPEKIQIGISSCLLGQKVRFDGGHKNSNYCNIDLAPFFDYISVCPEMAIGMGAPRKTIRQELDGDKIYLKSADGSIDVTDKLEEYSQKRVGELDFIGGYILCAKSPTCGMERVIEYKYGTNNGTKSGVGVFAKKLMDTYPELPVEEEGRLHDPVIKENFITRVYAYHEWHTLQAEGWTKHKLMQFHARYKYLLMAHSPQWYRDLGPILANIDDLDAAAQSYFVGFMTALKIKATRKNHTSTLQHIQGYFKKHLSKEQKQELTESIMKYREGLLPLLVPITLINHYLREYPTPYIEGQVYLNPHPEALRLRYAY